MLGEGYTILRLRTEIITVLRTVRDVFCSINNTDRGISRPYRPRWAITSSWNEECISWNEESISCLVMISQVFTILKMLIEVFPGLIILGEIYPDLRKLSGPQNFIIFKLV